MKRKDEMLQIAHRSRPVHAKQKSDKHIVIVSQIYLEELPPDHIIELDVKKSDSLAKKFISEYGDWAAELDALRPDYMRSLLRNAIESHIDVEHWERLKQVEAVERESIQNTLNW